MCRYEGIVGLELDNLLTVALVAVWHADEVRTSCLREPFLPTPSIVPVLWFCSVRYPPSRARVLKRTALSVNSLVPAMAARSAMPA